jgi:putative transcriptional regulator
MLRIKEILDKKGLTQVWLADKIDKNVVTVSNWCQNKNQPSLKTLVSIAKALNIKISDLFIEN